MVYGSVAFTFELQANALKLLTRAIPSSAKVDIPKPNDSHCLFGQARGI